MTAPSQQHSDELEADLRQYELAKHGSYDKRTEHLNADGYGLFINRLIREDSPYLLQHAHNPVNWFRSGHEVREAGRVHTRWRSCTAASRGSDTVRISHCARSRKAARGRMPAGELAA